MAAFERRKLCKYCLHAQPTDGHAEGCPRIDTDVARREAFIREWDAGFDLGYNDSYDEDGSYVFSWQVNNYRSAAFRLGYDLGRDECEKEVYDAVQSNYGHELDDDEDDYVLV
jgi:hypothetical protein